MFCSVNEYKIIYLVASNEDKMSPDSKAALDRVPQEGETDFFETNCHWRDCNKEFDTQDELVRVCDGYQYMIR